MSFISENQEAIRQLIIEKLGVVSPSFNGDVLEFTYAGGQYTYADEIDSLDSLRASINSETQFLALMLRGTPFNRLAAKGYVCFRGPGRIQLDDVFDRETQRIKVDELIAKLNADLPEEEIEATRSAIKGMRAV